MNKLAIVLPTLLAIFALATTTACHSDEQQAAPTSREQATDATEKEIADQRRKGHSESEGGNQDVSQQGTSLEDDDRSRDRGDYEAEGRRSEDLAPEDAESNGDSGDGEIGGGDIGGGDIGGGGIGGGDIGGGNIGS